MQNAPLRAFCNTFDLSLSDNRSWKQIYGLFDWPLKTGFTVDSFQRTISQFILKLTLHMLVNFACFFVICWFFSKLAFSKHFFRVYHLSQTVWIQIRPDIPSCLIWVQAVCSDYQKTTLAGTHLLAYYLKSDFQDILSFRLSPMLFGTEFMRLHMCCNWLIFNWLSFSSWMWQLEWANAQKSRTVCFLPSVFIISSWLIFFIKYSLEEHIWSTSNDYPYLSLPPRSNFCHLLCTFANSLDPDQDWQNVWPCLDPSCLHADEKNWFKK